MICKVCVRLCRIATKLWASQKRTYSIFFAFFRLVCTSSKLQLSDKVLTTFRSVVIFCNGYKFWSALHRKWLVTIYYMYTNCTSPVTRLCVEKRDVDVSQGLENHRVLALPSRNRTSIKVYEGTYLWLHFLQGGVEVKVEAEKKKSEWIVRDLFVRFPENARSSLL